MNTDRNAITFLVCIHHRMSLTMLLLLTFIVGGYCQPVVCNTVTPLILNEFDVSVDFSSPGLACWEGDLLCGGDDEPANVIDANTSNFATGNITGIGELTLSVTDNDSTYPAGYFAGFAISSGLLSTGVLSAITITTYLDNIEQESMAALDLVGLSSAFLSGVVEVGFVTSEDFDEIEITIDNLLGLGEYNVHYAFVERYCAGPELACNVQTAMNKPTYPMAIDFANTGISGVSVGYVDDPEASVSASTSDYASLVLLASVVGNVSLGVSEQVVDYPAGTFVGFEIENTDLLGLGLLDNITVTSFLNGIEQEDITGTNLLLNAPLLQTTGRYSVGFVTTMPADAVQIIVDQNGVDVGTTRVYHAIFQRFCEGDLECNTVTQVGTPDFPVYINTVRTGLTGALCGACELEDIGNVIDDDPDNFAEITIVAGALNGGSISVRDALTEYPANSFAGFHIENTALVDVGVLDGFTITTYLDGTLQEEFSGLDILAAVGTDLLVNPGEMYLGFVTEEPFDEVQLSLENLAMVTLGTTLVYGALFGEFCPAEVVCDTTYFLNSPDFPVYVDYALTGLSGIACALCEVEDPHEVITETNTDFATITLVGDVGAVGSIAVRDALYTYPPGTIAGFVVEDVNGFLQAGVFGGVTISTYLDGVFQESESADNLIDAELLILFINPDVGVYNLGFETTLPFDEIRISVTALVDALNVLDVYGAFVDTRNSQGGEGELNCPDAPIAVDDINVTPEDSPAIGNVLTNDEDPNGDTLTVNTVPVDPPDNGMVVLNPDGSYTYTPDPGFTGEDQFSYEVCDNGVPSLCDTAVVYIEVIGDPAVENLPPVANPDANSTEVNTPIIGDLLSNDSDPNGDDLVINTAPVIAPTNGDVMINEDGTYTYEPDPDFVGEDTFVYAVCDDQLPTLCDTAIVVINVLPDNGNNTFAHDDAAVTNENTPVMGNVSSNDFDPEGDDQIVNTTPLTQPSNGSVVLAADGSYTYTPDAGFSGNDFFEYETCDNGTPVACDIATVSIAVFVSIAVSPLINPPVAIDDINVTPQDSPASGNVLTNDFDPDGDTLMVSTMPVTDPENGTVELNGDGSYTYTPTPGFTGEDQFSYSVCDDESPVLCDTAIVYIEVIGDPSVENLPPVGNPDANLTEVNTPVTGVLLSNDSDPNGDALVINTAPVIAPANGDVTINPDGTYTYEPFMDIEGEDTFVYEVCDDQVPPLCDTAIVVINVIPDDGNNTFAHDDAAVTNENTPIMGNVSANDFDPEGHVQIVNTTLVTDPANGSVVIAANGSYTYTPDPGFSGNDFFTYETCDNGSPQMCDIATVSIAVLPVNSPPIAMDDINVTPEDSPANGNVLTNDDDPEGDNLTVNTTPVTGPDNGMVVLNADGSYTYTPDPGFTGEDQFTYEVCDDGTPSLCDTAVVYIEVIGDPASSNLPPVANPDANATEENIPVSGNLLSNDSDPNGDDLLINTTPLDSPENGIVTINGDGTYLYTPDPGFIGQDTFIYEVCDDQTPALCDTAIVVIHVIPDGGNNTFANDDAAVTSVNTPVDGDLSQNDFDPEEDAQTVNTSPVMGPANGSVVINPDGTFTYTPDPGFVGNDFFTYETCDDGVPVACDTATAYIAVIQRCIQISAWVYLEGSLIDDQGQGIYASEMRTDLNDLHILPGQLVVDPFLGDQYTPPLGSMDQVYNVAPWNYAGAEGSYYDSDSIAANADADYPSTVTDWVLVSLRSDPNNGSENLCQRAALLHNDGRLEFVEDAACCELDLSMDYHLVIEHRNHLIVMSDTAISITRDTIAHDFRIQQSYDEDPFSLGLVGQKEVTPGVFAMYAGNCDQSSTPGDDTDINSSDFNRWDNENNQFLLYIIGDIDMNGDVNSNDFNLWQTNEQTITSVIRN